MRNLCFVILMLVVFFVSSTCKAANFELFYKESQQATKSYLQIKNSVDFRDFDFFMTMLFIQIKSYTEECKEIKQSKISSKAKETKLSGISGEYFAIFSAQLISAEQYIKRYVIAKSLTPVDIKQKCQPILLHLENARKALR